MKYQGTHFESADGLWNIAWLAMLGIFLLYDILVEVIAGIMGTAVVLGISVYGLFFRIKNRYL